MKALAWLVHQTLPPATGYHDCLCHVCCTDSRLFQTQGQGDGDEVFILDFQVIRNCAVKLTDYIPLFHLTGPMFSKLFWVVLENKVWTSSCDWNFPSAVRGGSRGKGWVCSLLRVTVLSIHTFHSLIKAVKIIRHRDYPKETPLSIMSLGFTTPINVSLWFAQNSAHNSNKQTTLELPFLKFAVWPQESHLTFLIHLFLLC
jgi:hypothetical protein